MRLRDLAENLGLSQTTVSRALNGYPEVSEATRRRVEDAAARFNYRPSSRARSLATGRAMAIGHVIPRMSSHEIVNPVFTDFVAGASETYTSAGYDLLMSVVGEGDEAQVYRELRARQSVDGFIVHSPRVEDSRLELLKSIGLPFVVHGRAGDSEAGYSWVDINNRRAFEQATQHLLALGHRRIALLNGLETLDFARRRRVGYLDALAAAGVSPDPALMVSDEMTEANGYQGAVRLLALPDRPTAFIASSYIMALGIRRAAEEAHLTLGRDLSLITHDDELSYLQNGGDTPVITALRSSVRMAGQVSAEMLIDLIHTPGQSPRSRLLEVQFVEGRSTGPAPQD